MQRGVSGGLALVLLAVGSLAGQDVELLGKLHGTRPPQAYFDLIRRDPGAYQYQRALFRRGLRLPDLPPVRVEGRALSTVFTPQLAGALASGEQQSPVAGSFTFPLILGLFNDSPDLLEPYARENVQREYFDGPQANPRAVGTIPEFYDELSGGRVALGGVTFDWQRTSLSRFEVTAGESGLGSNARTGEFIIQILQSLDDGTVDWGRFDNDGPDGIPNSGDDDGYVDVLAIMHPTPGGECSSPERPNRIWSHRWNILSSASYSGGAWAQPILESEGYVTASPAAPGSGANFIRILDYTIQPVTDCSGENLNTIGVFAHELGHGFGLPDLYGVGASHAGAGNWALMGTGSWGCNGVSPWLPCHMSAWSKEVLGWAEVESLPPGTDLGTLTLPPVETSGTIYRIDSGDGSGEYFLLENRQRLLFDQNLIRPGLLVWHIDPAVIAEKWPLNSINSDGDHMGIWLLQADGSNDLGRAGGGRGDAGDPFPGAYGQTELHASTSPSSWTHGGNAMGITLLDIRTSGREVEVHAITGYQPLTLRTEGSPTGQGLISVDEVSSPEAQWTYWSAPFQQHLISAAPGEEIGEGIRIGFQGWDDGAPRVRAFQTGLSGETFTATYGGREVFLDIELQGPVEGIAPGTISFTPGDSAGWVPEGELVVLSAQARTGFGFVEWTGPLAGQPNPTTFTASGPLEAGALFELTFSTAANPDSLEVEAATAAVLTLSVENANAPVTWSLSSGALPDGMLLDPVGRIVGAALELGAFPLTFHVRDAIGLEADLPLDLLIVDPQIPVSQLASPFLLSGELLEASQRTFLDREGNRNGVYDLGDFRAFFIRNPDLPLSGELRQVIELLVPLGDLRRETGRSGNEGTRGEGVP